MKLSNYTSTLEFESKYFLYNSFSDIFVELSVDLYSLYKNLNTREDISHLKFKNLQFYRALIRSGIIIELNNNELDTIKAKFHDVVYDKRIYQLIINPTLQCNFDCWYCYETHLKKSVISDNTLTKLKSFIDNILANDEIEKFHISWFGGEPLIYYKSVIKKISDYVFSRKSDKIISTSFTSNGYLIKDFMLPEFVEMNTENFQITLDGHRENHNKVRKSKNGTGSYDQIVINIKKLLKSGINTTVRFNYTNENINDFSSVLNDFKKIGIEAKRRLNFSLHKVWQADTPDNHENIIIEYLNQGKIYGLTINSKVSGLNSIENLCYADKVNHATINYNGEVFKCTARDFETKNSEGILMDDGNILWNNIYKKRILSIFKNEPCLNCKILPICHGGCSQHYIESNGQDYCIYDFNEYEKIKVIKNRLKSVIH